MAEIELVIKIQEHDKAVIDRFVNGEGFEVLPTPIVDKVIRAVRNGTPLPKGHGRLIDVNEITAFRELECNGCNVESLDEFTTIIEADRAESEGKG